MTLEEAIKNMNREQLEETILKMNQAHKEFEKGLIEELGFETYIDIAKEIAFKKAKKHMQEMGMSEEEIQNNAKYFGIKKKEKN